MSAEFYAEDLGIGLGLAEKVSDFVSLAKNQEAISKVTPWVKDGMVRVYIELWSQNSMKPLDMLEKCFYDAVDHEVYFIQYGYGRTEK